MIIMLHHCLIVARTHQTLQKVLIKITVHLGRFLAEFCPVLEMRFLVPKSQLKLKTKYRENKIKLDEMVK